VQENSWWTWVRGDGAPYAPSEIPALWLRVADRRWPDAGREFGPLADYGGLIRTLDTNPDTGAVTGGVASHGRDAAIREDATGWKTLHYRLRAMAKLWQPAPDNPAIHRLIQFNVLQHADAIALRNTLSMAASDGELTPRLDGWHLRIVPQNLRGYLLMTCAADVAAHQRFRRCAHCNEWFALTRADAKHCSPACRQAFHQANKEAS
jgi:hypothetical protein